MNREILRIALPSIVSNITVPLLGLVDVAIVGHLGATGYIGAIAVGGMLFNVIYWLFAFLRMGTSGLTSQAFGAHSISEQILSLLRACVVALIIAAILILCQVPLRKLSFLIVSPTAEVATLTQTYFHICIWGAPAMLLLYGLTGWFIGMQNAKIPLWIAIVQNLTNILCSLLFVYGLNMKIEGVATGTLIAQYAGLLTALVLGRKYYLPLFAGRTMPLLNQIWNKEAMLRFFSINRDIFLRTLCLVAVTIYFTAAGAAQSDTILAVNTLLMQLFTLYSYIMDGFAFAGEAMCGRFYGARDKRSFMLTVKHLWLWGLIMAALFTLVYVLGGKHFLALLTDQASVIDASGEYFFWAILIPAAGLLTFIWDGIYIGLTASRVMLVAMVSGATVFFALYLSTGPMWGNHALWLAFLCYLLTRGIVESIIFRRYTRGLCS